MWNKIRNLFKSITWGLHIQKRWNDWSCPMFFSSCPSICNESWHDAVVANPSSCKRKPTNAKDHYVLHLHPLDQFPQWKSHGCLRQRSRGKWHIRQNSLRPAARAVCASDIFRECVKLVKPCETDSPTNVPAAFARSRHCPSGTCRKISSWIAMIHFVKRNNNMAQHRQYQNTNGSLNGILDGSKPARICWRFRQQLYLQITYQRKFR